MLDEENNNVTFMFTDIEGSTRLWEEYDRTMEAVLAQHDEIVHGTVDACGGEVFKHTGDGLAAAFPEAQAAARAALRAQQLLASADWGPIGKLRCRIGIHSGRAQHRAREYFGRDVNRAARIMDAAHGGQVLISGPTAEILRSPGAEEWLIRDLGSHQLKDLSQPEQVFQLCHPELPATFPLPRTVERIPRQLPALAELFFGRDVDIRRMGELLRNGRLIAMTGPGGVGKTQLAIAAALDYLRDFPDGAWFCPLANVSTIEEIAELIEATMGLQATGGAGALDHLTIGLASRRALIILDGAEHALAAVKHVAGSLMEACQNVTIICTSREALHARREQVLAVGPLIVPEPDLDDIGEARLNASVALFERRAQLADSAFEVTPGNLGAVISICRQLDGLPLAVELAAAQMAALDPQDLADRIGLRVGLIDDRDQTLGTIVDWSYRSLSDRERMLFQRLAVFAGGFSLAFAERVCVDSEIALEDVMPGLADLVSKSVVSIQRTLDGNRYVMLELLRSYAMRQLTNTARTEERRQRHLDAYVEFAARAQDGLTTRNEADWVKRVAIEFANLRVAFSWALEAGRVDRALELIYYTDGFARERFRRELDAWAEEALNAAHGDEDYIFAAKSVLASAAARRGDTSSAYRLSDEALECAQRSCATDPFMPYRLFTVTGILSGDAERARRGAEEAIQRATQLQRPYEIARFKSMRALATLLGSDPENANELAASALDAARSIGNPSLLAWCLYAAGTLESDERRALVLLEESIEFADMVGNRYIAGIALQVACWKRRSAVPEEIAAGFSRVINYWYRVANWANLASSLRLCVMSMQGLDEELVAVVDGWLEHGDTRSVFSSNPEDPYARAVANIVSSMGADSFRAAADRGATMNATQIVHYCRQALGRHMQRQAG